MKYIFLVGLMALSFQAYSNQLGLGISLGNPTGLNGKYWLDKKSAIDGGLAMSIGKNSDLSIHSDYLFHKHGALYFNDVHALDLYYGIGGRMEFSDDIDLGLRIPVGLAHTIDNQPADIFAEVAPIFDFLSNSSLELHLLFGARYYF